MSDPVTNVEIEDVLSSIRRLVSESGGAGADARASKASTSSPQAQSLADDAADQQDPAPAPEANTGAKAGLDKLVLTPSLRIAEALALPPEEEEKTAAQDPQDQAAQADTAPEAEPKEAQEPEAQAAPVPEEVSALADAQDDKITPSQPEAAAGESLKRRIEQLEAAVSTQDETWDEDESDTGSESHTGSGDALPWEDHNSEAIEPEQATYFSEVSDEVEDDAGDLAEDIAETPSEQSSEQPIDPAPTPEEPAQDSYDFLAGDETLIDEDALREMVADIVRQELQGALGERITRNVRKLVRREIHRALMAQEFE
ncbi:hypothetical protein [Lentibacter sp.]|uniref:hypothetical protein n=1 Tax=Lentibacter sp. TaxID=2024994 RepID=UPI003F69711A